MKIKFIKILAIILLIVHTLRFFMNVFFGAINPILFLHLFANILWIIALIGLFKIQNWGRVLAIYLSVFYLLIFVMVATMSLIDRAISDITPKYLQGVAFSVFYIAVLNLKPIKEIFLNKLSHL